MCFPIAREIAGCLDIPANYGAISSLAWQRSGTKIEVFSRENCRIRPRSLFPVMKTPSPSVLPLRRVQFPVSHIAFTAASLFALLLGSTIRGQESASVRDQNVEAQLVSSVTAVTPGEPFTLGLRFSIDETWHTYWENPGDAGRPNGLTLQLPEGFAATPLEFPAPEKFIVDYGYGVRQAGFGYEHEVIHPFTVTPPAGLAPGSTVRIAGKADWLMCDPETCIPGSAELVLELPVAAEGAGSEPSSWQSPLEKARDSVPVAKPWSLTAERTGDHVRVAIAFSPEDAPPQGEVHFYPLVNGVFDLLQGHASAERESSRLAIEHPAAEGLEEIPSGFAGVLVVETEDGSKSYRLGDASMGGGEKEESPGADGPASGPGAALTSTGDGAPVAGPFGGGLLGMLLAAFLGGIILNVMPCVFPVISLKVMSFIGQAGEDRKKILAHSLVFCLGIFLFFWILCGSLLAVRSLGGGEVGWGIQLQQPAFIIALIFVMVAVALSLFGLVEFGTGIQSVGGNLASASGYAGSFWSGALAVLLATPCTAPLMAPAIAFALAQSAPVMFLVFTALAFGLAFPYLLLAAFPGLLNRLPKPGQWMETFKQFMGFPMLAVAVWLAGVLSKQLQVAGLQWSLGAVLLLALALWILGRFTGFEHGKTKRVTARVLALAVFLSSLGLAFHATKLRATNDAPDIAEVIAAKRAEGKNVFVDFTAEWCVNCKINKRVAINTEEVKKAFAEHNIELVTADYTNEDPRITEILKAHGRAGVPLYLLYPADPSLPAIQLPDGLIRPANIYEAIGQLP